MFSFSNRHTNIFNVVFLQVIFKVGLRQKGGKLPRTLQKYFFNRIRIVAIVSIKVEQNKSCSVNKQRIFDCLYSFVLVDPQIFKDFLQQETIGKTDIWSHLEVLATT